MNTNALLVREDGTTSVVDLTAGGRDILDGMSEHLACEWVDRVPVTAGLDVWLDDTGLTTGRDRNLVGTSLAAGIADRQPAQWLHGPILFVGLDGEDTTGLTEQQLTMLAITADALRRYLR